MKFTVYSKPNCGYCDKAKSLLKLKGAEYEEKIIDVGQPKVEGVTYVTVQDLKAIAPAAKSVPQIFLDGKNIGGYAELEKLIGA